MRSGHTRSHKFTSYDSDEDGESNMDMNEVSVVNLVNLKAGYCSKTNVDSKYNFDC